MRTFRAVVMVALLLNLGTILALSELRWRFSDQFSSLSPRLRFSRHIEDVGAGLRHRLGPGDALAIDNYNVESNEVAAVAGSPLLPGDWIFDAAVSRQHLRSDLWSFIAVKRLKSWSSWTGGTYRPFCPCRGGAQRSP